MYKFLTWGYFTRMDSWCTQRVLCYVPHLVSNSFNSAKVLKPHLCYFWMLHNTPWVYPPIFSLFSQQRTPDCLLTPTRTKNTAVNTLTKVLRWPEADRLEHRGCLRLLKHSLLCTVAFTGLHSHQQCIRIPTAHTIPPGDAAWFSNLLAWKVYQGSFTPHLSKLMSLNICSQACWPFRFLCRSCSLTAHPSTGAPGASLQEFPHS